MKQQIYYLYKKSQKQITFKKIQKQKNNMTLYFHNDSSYAKTQQLELSSKFEIKKQDQDDQVLLLCEKITQLQKNYIAMQKHYTEKIKILYQLINQKDKQFLRLQNQMHEVKTIAIDHRKKVEELSKNATQNKTLPEPRVKNKSPLTINSARASQKIVLQNIEMKPSTKSPSPKNEPKKVSPSHKPVVLKRTTMVAKISTGSSDSGNIPKNNSPQKLTKKSNSPKGSYQRSKNFLTKVDEVESLKMVKKTVHMASFRQKPPTFK